MYQSFSRKQMLVMTWWNHPQINQRYDAIICDGSIRSGKTISMSTSFLLWAMATFDGQSFAICGKTVTSCQRNVITPLFNALGGIVTARQLMSKNYIEVRWNGHSNRFYVFGGKDEGSAALIQGVTLAGVLFDEVALMPESFVNQAVARCSVAGSKFWFNCNPDCPGHWFYTEWIADEQKRHRALRLHFTMEDNPTLDPAVKRRYEGMYTGVFYDRFIRGMWVAAEGLIYTMFDRDRNVVRSFEPVGRWFVSMDYGTVNPCSMGLWCLNGDKAVRVSEYYYDSRKPANGGRQKTDEEYYMELEKLVGDRHLEFVVVDPSAASFMETIRRHGRFRVRGAVNDVLDGIRLTSSLLLTGRITIHESCKDCIREFGAYAWDPDSKAGDKVKKEHDHAMDDVRYFANTILRREVRHMDWM